MKRTLRTLLLIILLSLTLVSLARAAGPVMVCSVIGGGGGTVTGGAYTLNSTLGQAVVGSVTSGPLYLCAGFWCMPGGFQLHCPLVLKP